jgi:Big-like domain-containing protein
MVRTACRLGTSVLAIVVALSCSGGGPTGGDTRVGPPAQVLLVSGDAQTGTVGEQLPQPVVVRVTDSHGRPIPGQLVNFHVTAGGGSVFAGSSITDDAGEARERWTLGTVAGAAQQLEARAVNNATGEAIVFATFNAIAVAGAPTALRLANTPASSPQAGVPLSPGPAIQLQDRYGNSAKREGVAVAASVTAPAEGMTLGGSTTALTNAEGLATFNGLSILGRAGSVTLGFAAAGLTGTSTPELSLRAGTPTAISRSAGEAQAAPAGSPVSVPPAVRLVDAFGNPASGIPVTFSVTGGGGTITGESATTDAQGIAAVGSWTLGTTPGTNTLTASAASLTLTFTATATTGSATKIVAVSPTTQNATSGSPVELVVRVTDAFGNAVAGAEVHWTIDGGTVNASASTTDADGVARMTVVPINTGTVVATASLSTGSNVRFSFTVSPGAPAKLVKLAGDKATAYAGTPVATPPSVRVLDAYDHPIAGASVRFTVKAGGGSASGTPVTSNSTGVATVGSWTLGPVAGTTNTLTAAAGDASADFTATASVPFAIASIDAPSGGVPAADSIQVTVHLTKFVSTAHIASVTAQIGTQTGQLTGDAGGLVWSGKVASAGLATGSQSVLVTATDDYGNVVRRAQGFTYGDQPPTLIVDAPRDGMVSRIASIEARARCQDETPGCKLSVSYSSFSVPNPQVLATGTESIAATLTLPTSDHWVRFDFQASDATGHVVRESRMAYVETSALLTAIDSVPGRIQGLDDARILYVRGSFVPSLPSGHPVLRDRSTGAESTSDSLELLSYGNYLTKYGAVLTGRPAGTNAGHVFDWHFGATARDLGEGTPTAPAGDYFSWYSFNLQRYDMRTGQNLTVTTLAPAGHNALATGDVIFAANRVPPGDYQVFRWHDGTPTMIASDTACHSRPQADEVRVVYMVDHCELRPTVRLAALEGASEVVLTPGVSGVNFLVNAGWLLYAFSLDGTHFEYHLRSPAAEDFIAFTRATSDVESLSTNGSFTFREGGRRYAAIRSGSSVNVTEVGSSIGSPFWINGELFIVIGGNIFSTGLR